MSFVDQQKYEAELNIDLGTKCNLRCHLCQRAYLTHQKEPSKAKQLFIDKMRKSKEISLDNLRKMFAFSKNNIALCGQISDPILHSKFLDILDLMNEYPNVNMFRIATAANGPSLEWYKNAFERTPKNCRWVFGIDGLPDTSMIYREGQNSQLVWDAMMLGNDMGVDVSWQYIVFEYNVHQIKEALRIAEEKNMRIVILDSNRLNPEKVETRTVYNFRKGEFLTCED